LAGAAFAGLAPGAAADEVADFYRGKTVTVTYPTAPGGTFHLYAELVRRHLAKHLPGEPNLILQNRPGAGGLTMNHFMAQAAPKDGTVVAEINPGTLPLPLIRQVQFDPRAFEWLGSVAVRNYVGAIWHTVEADTIEDSFRTPPEVAKRLAGLVGLDKPGN
jgi:tripartite-type tricarboxylate transporter receptor subunit TctC